MLKFSNAKIIDLHDWDDLVKKTYNKEYSFQQQDGCKERGIFRLSVPDYPDDYEADSIPEKINGEEMGVSFAAWLAKDCRNATGIYKDSMFWERNFYPNVQMIANDLFERGLMEKGDYIIEIDW